MLEISLARFALFRFLTASPATVETARLLDAITQRVSVLVAEQGALRAQLAAAQHRVRELEAELAGRDEQARDDRSEESLLRLTGSLATDPATATELKLRINDYLREIDRCIAYLKD